MEYIIDIPNEIAEASARYWKETTNMTLVPYTEPDKEQIENEVWEFIKICFAMDGSDFVDAFDSCSYINLLEYSYQKAKAKYDAWKAEKDDIRVGDEVKITEGGSLCVVCGIVSGTANLIFEDGGLGQFPVDKLIRTGRHLNTVEKLLEEMREEL